MCQVRLSLPSAPDELGGYDSVMENDTLIAAEQDQLDEVDDELLVEEISIDGMCGVY